MKTLGESWQLSRRRIPDATAVVVGERRLSYRALTDRASRLASALQRLGVGHQDRVSLMATNRLEWFEYYAAAEMYGFVASTVNFRLAAPEVAFILQDCDPKVFLFAGPYAAIGRASCEDRVG